MTTAQFDPIIHAPHRLRICAVLDTVSHAEFAILREATGASESVMSKQVRALEDAGYVTVTKGARDGRTRTWASLTPLGKTAYRRHVAELRRIVGESLD